MPLFIRYQSAAPNPRGTFPGVFALANGLRRNGMLDPADAHWLLRANEQATAQYRDPSTVEPNCYDPTLHPGARSWFRADATTLLAMSVGYLDLLDRYRVPWVELRTTSPGRITYEDEVQIVATPMDQSHDWPFRPSQ
ncbi:hypothetical protein EDF28_3788 [Curtobacterium sp. PhB137]|uniref:hypothetical protein n=1 Tax=Curtobacterium sp. PhB137 TaxID=2485182 RepID=UPI000F515921|nr:hypothetical protein [Curtobacterium sp. PhB137]RPE74729.1 hypothetical protein EDF28_3788 [Curtobacterium sp. PhB137]